MFVCNNVKCVQICVLNEKETFIGLDTSLSDKYYLHVNHFTITSLRFRETFIECFPRLSLFFCLYGWCLINVLSHYKDAVTR